MYCRKSDCRKTENKVIPVKESQGRKFDFYAKLFFLIYMLKSVLPKGRSFTANARTKVAVLLKAGFPLQAKERRLQFY